MLQLINPDGVLFRLFRHIQLGDKRLYCVYVGA